MSWLLQFDIDQAREKFNFSDWANNSLEDPKYFAKSIEGGKMPPARYLMMHAEAKLTDAEKQQLIDGLGASIK